VRRAAKHLGELVLCASGATRLARARLSDGALVLAYHDIAPDEANGPDGPDGANPAGDASLHLPRREFARQLDRLARTHDIVPLPAVLEPRRGRRPRAAITFDDAYEGALSEGVPELVDRGLPATIFVAPAFADGRDFWWDALAGPDGLPDEVRAHALGALGGRDAAVRRWAAARGWTPRPLPSHMHAARESRIAAVAALPGITLAAHTWSHPVLPALAADELRQELVRPLAWLRERFERVLPWLTYPYGATSPEVASSAAALGYAAALRVDGGWLHHPARADRFDLPRLNIPAGLSARGFQLRASGLLQER